MEKLKEAILIVVAALVGLGGIVFWILGLLGKRATEKELKDLQEKLEAERKAKAEAQKAAIDGKTPKEVVDGLPQKDKDAIKDVVDSHTESAIDKIKDALKKRSSRIG